MYSGSETVALPCARSSGVALHRDVCLFSTHLCVLFIILVDIDHLRDAEGVESTKSLWESDVSPTAKPTLPFGSPPPSKAATDTPSSSPPTLRDGVVGHQKGLASCRLLLTLVVLVLGKLPAH